AAADRWRHLRARGDVGDHPGRLLQAHRQTCVQDGAAPSPLRVDRMERAEGHHPFFDRVDHLCVVQSDDAEVAVMAWVMTRSRWSGARWWWSVRRAAESPQRNCWRDEVRVWC